MGFEIVGVHNHLQFNNEFKKKMLFIAGIREIEIQNVFYFDLPST